MTEESIPILQGIINDPEQPLRERLKAFEMVARFSGLENINYDPEPAAERENYARLNPQPTSRDIVHENLLALSNPEEYIRRKTREWEDEKPSVGSLELVSK